MEESPGMKPKKLERVHNTVPNGRYTTPVQMENATAEDVQKAAAGSKVEESVADGAEIVGSPEDSTKLLSFGELPQDMKLCSPGVTEIQAESPTGISSSSKHITLDHKHEFGSEMVNNEAMEENHVIATENTDNGPIKDQKSEFDHINMEQKETLPEEVTQNNCLESSTSQIDNQSRKFSGDLLGQPTGDAAKDHIHLEQQMDNATNNAGLEQLGPGQETATKGPSHLGDTVKGTPVLPRKGEISLTSSRGSVKVLSEKRKKTQELSVNSSRSLRSRSQEKSKAPDLSNIVTEEGADRDKKKKKRKKRMEKDKVDEFSRIRTHLRYLLHRIKYEKNFIDAYLGEGWKGQSLEKLKPEKELQRAKSEILRRKLKIRDLFQRLDLLCAEGRIPETLFDSEGEIDSEDIFCAKCGSSDVTLSNDIILCDGACERGFHQFCLDPPLLKEHIPPGDEGWLCPGCDCKVDCIELLNDSQGTKISVSDSWEKVFAEEAAAVAAGKNLDDISGLPSDDSEDDDYNPDGPNMDEKVQGDVSNSDESDYHSASDDLQVLPQKEPFLGLPSDDSEDDDYDPSGLETDQKSKMESSSSDFTSDSEDFTVVLDDCKPSSEVQGPLTSTPDHVKNNEEGCGHPEQGDPASMYPRRQVKRLDYKKLHDEEYGNTSSDSSDEEYNSEEEDAVLPNLETDQKSKMESSSSDFTSDSEDFTVVLDDCKPSSEVQGPLTSTPDHVRNNEEGCGHPEQGDPASMYPRRQVKRLDYKKLHDEEYGNTSSDSSDEEYNSEEEDAVLPNLENLTTEHGKETGDSEKDQKTNESTQRKRRFIKKFDADGTNSTPARSRKGSSATSGKNPKTSFGKHATQGLLQSFKENQYPQRAVKESLATELALSVQQVSKWFENARHSFRHSSHKASDVAEFASAKGTPRQKSINFSESDSKSVLDSATCSEVKQKKQDKGSAAVTECCDRDMTPNVVADEGNGHNPSITKTRKRKAKFGGEATKPNKSLDKQDIGNAVTECCDRDMTPNMVADEDSGHNPSITKTRKRKAKFGSEVTEPNTSLETPKQNAKINPPKTQGVRKSSRIQSKSKESIS